MQCARAFGILLILLQLCRPRCWRNGIEALTSRRLLDYTFDTGMAIVVIQLLINRGRLHPSRQQQRVNEKTLHTFGTCLNQDIKITLRSRQRAPPPQSLTVVFNRWRPFEHDHTVHVRRHLNQKIPRSLTGWQLATSMQTRGMPALLERLRICLSITTIGGRRTRTFPGPTKYHLQG